MRISVYWYSWKHMEYFSSHIYVAIFPICISQCCICRLYTLGWIHRCLNGMDAEPTDTECGLCKGLEHLQMMVPGRGRVLEFVSLKIPRADCICLLSGHFWCIVIIVNILKYFYYIYTQMKRETRFWRLEDMGFLVLWPWEVAISSYLKWGLYEVYM